MGTKSGGKWGRSVFDTVIRSNLLPLLLFRFSTLWRHRVDRESALSHPLLLAFISGQPRSSYNTVFDLRSLSLLSHSTNNTNGPFRLSSSFGSDSSSVRVRNACVQIFNLKSSGSRWSRHRIDDKEAIPREETSRRYKGRFITWRLVLEEIEFVRICQVQPRTKINGE